LNRKSFRCEQRRFDSFYFEKEIGVAPDAIVQSPRLEGYAKLAAYDRLPAK